MSGNTDELISALVSVETANKRAMDLTRRLGELRAEIKLVKNELSRFARGRGRA